MGHKTVQVLTPGANRPPFCPVPHDSQQSSLLSKLNPLNYMFQDLSQSPAPNQTHILSTTREPSSIPKGSGDSNWEYPSPQQMYNALLRKGYTDTDVTAVEGFVSVHNFLNEGAWNEIVEWEKRFSGGLMRGAKICSWGEDNIDKVVKMYPDTTEMEPRLVKFQGRPKDMTPKAAIAMALGKVMPDRFT